MWLLEALGTIRRKHRAVLGAYFEAYNFFYYYHTDVCRIWKKKACPSSQVSHVQFICNNNNNNDNSNNSCLFLDFMWGSLGSWAVTVYFSEEEIRAAPAAPCRPWEVTDALVLSIWMLGLMWAQSQLSMCGWEVLAGLVFYITVFEGPSFIQQSV